MEPLNYVKKQRKVCIYGQIVELIHPRTLFYLNLAKRLLLCVRRYIAKHCGVSLKSYKIIFTSGASESNCLILKSTVDAYKKHTGKIPHIITSVNRTCINY